MRGHCRGVGPGGPHPPHRQGRWLSSQVLEELEVLGSDCARVITRLRARLAPKRQAALDGAAAALSPAFDLQAAHGHVPVALPLQHCCLFRPA